MFQSAEQIAEAKWIAQQPLDDSAANYVDPPNVSMPGTKRQIASRKNGLKGGRPRVYLREVGRSANAVRQQAYRERALSVCPRRRFGL